MKEIKYLQNENLLFHAIILKLLAIDFDRAYVTLKVAKLDKPRLIFKQMNFNTRYLSRNPTI